MNLNIKIIEYDTTMTHLKVIGIIEGQTQPKEFWVNDHLTGKIFDEIYSQEFHSMTVSHSNNHSWIVSLS